MTNPCKWPPTCVLFTTRYPFRSLVTRVNKLHSLKRFQFSHWISELFHRSALFHYRVKKKKGLCRRNIRRRAVPESGSWRIYRKFDANSVWSGEGKVVEDPGRLKPRVDSTRYLTRIPREATKRRQRPDKEREGCSLASRLKRIARTRDPK